MTLSLSQFHDLVRDTVNRGTKFDTQIVNRTRQAARWIERNYSLKYMDRLEEFCLLSGCSEFSLPAFEIKSVRFLRIVSQDADDLTDPTDSRKFYYLKQVAPEDFDREKSDRPTAYWHASDTNRLILNSAPSQDYDAEFFVAQYTEWPTDTTKTHWLLNHADDVLLSKTIELLGPVIRSQKLMTEHQNLLQSGLASLLEADQDLRKDNSSPFMSMYLG